MEGPASRGRRQIARLQESCSRPSRPPPTHRFDAGDGHVHTPLVLSRARLLMLIYASTAALFAAPARASLTAIFSPASLTIDGTVTWPGSDLDILTNPFLVDVTGAEPLQLLVTAPDAVILRRNTSSSWAGSALPPGTDLVWFDAATGPVTLAFGGNIQGVGFYLEAELVANTTFTIEAFDDGLQSLGSVQAFAPFGSGFFWGVVSDAQDIRTLTVSSSFDNDLVLSGPVVQVPEPATVCLGLLGVAGLVGRRLRRGSARRIAPPTGAGKGRWGGLICNLGLLS